MRTMVEKISAAKKMATRTLPEAYREINRIDLKQNVRLAVLLNLAAIPLFFAAGWFFLQIIAQIRPDANQLWGALSGTGNLILLLLSVFVMIVLHEMVHGLFFWVFTRDRPVFAFRFLYAYAAAPDWYIPRNQYVIIGLAPLFVISLIGIFLFFGLPIYGVAYTLLLVSFNAAGAVGDLAICLWLLTRSPNLMICDQGDAARVFGPAL